ncbi:MAG: hypothetical protein UIH41_10880 [Treponemataceae bacterium]|nr:hypothetical protein [Treponemataceae bacterium]
MKKIIFPLILSLLTFPSFSQNLQDNLEVENVQESFIEKSFIEDGVYENGNKFLVFEENDILQGKNKEKGIAETVKIYYGFFYDGQFQIEKDPEPITAATLNSGLYLEYFRKSDLSVFPKGYLPESENQGYFMPCSNMTDIALSPARRLEKLYGYLVLPQNQVENDVENQAKNQSINEEATEHQIIYQIEYWFTDQEYEEALAYFYLEKGNEESKVQLEKYIKIGSMVYTCTVGRRTLIRNPQEIQELPENQVFNEDFSLMAFGNPDFIKSTEFEGYERLQKEIEKHNSIINPPRFAVRPIKEPSIYKFLEEMEIK